MLHYRMVDMLFDMNDVSGKKEPRCSTYTMLEMTDKMIVHCCSYEARYPSAPYEAPYAAPVMFCLFN